jgi:hypothetical protein
MAAIEKMDEVTGEGCGWDMYAWKRDHIQVAPETRKLFKGKKATLYIFKPNEDSLFHIQRWGGYTRISYNKEFYDKIDGNWHVWKRNYLKPGYEKAVPCYVTTEYNYVLYVPEIQGEVEGRYHQDSFKIASVKRRINRMMGYKVPVVKLDITEREFYKLSNEERKTLFV